MTPPETRRDPGEPAFVPGRRYAGGVLNEVLEPHVAELVVVVVRKGLGAKSDKQDAFGLGEQLRIGTIETRVYKGRGQLRRLGCLAKAYGFLVDDVVRVKNRLKSVLRSRGVGYGAGQSE